MKKINAVSLFCLGISFGINIINIFDNIILNNINLVIINCITEVFIIIMVFIIFLKK